MIAHAVFNWQVTTRVTFPGIASSRIHIPFCEFFPSVLSCFLILKIVYHVLYHKWRLENHELKIEVEIIRYIFRRKSFLAGEWIQNSRHVGSREILGSEVVNFENRPPETGTYLYTTSPQQQRCLQSYTHRLYSLRPPPAPFQKN